MLHYARGASRHSAKGGIYESFERFVKSCLGAPCNRHKTKLIQTIVNPHDLTTQTPTRKTRFVEELWKTSTWSSMPPIMKSPGPKRSRPALPPKSRFNMSSSSFKQFPPKRHGPKNLQGYESTNATSAVTKRSTAHFGLSMELEGEGLKCTTCPPTSLPATTTWSWPSTR